MSDAGRNLVYLVEDERDIARLICTSLKDYGYRTEAFATGRDIVHRVKQQAPALCIVDLGLPDADGLQVVKAIQDRCCCGIIILTGRGHTSDRVAGLELGADDYVVKPFEPRELIARVRSVLRRFERAETEQRPGMAARFSGWRFDFASHQLTGPTGDDVPLSTAEAELLKALLRAPNRILTRDYLLDLKDPANQSPFDRSIDVRISRLRKKIEPDPQNPNLIKTVYGAGYIFATQVAWE